VLGLTTAAADDPLRGPPVGNREYMTDKARHLAGWFAVAWAAAAIVALALLPVYSSVADRTNGQAVRSSATLVSVNGLRVLWLLAIPLLASLSAIVPTPSDLQRPLRIVAAAIVSLFVLISAMSVGVFFAPTAVALILAAIGPGKARVTRSCG
jgi:hypothetical protein